ncbi:MAG: 50S ribosomal protein L25 [Candidatus Kerfeldbacteria bacterium]|nr:50S ribosomal protein L25 [Candidatus Kerfeldbacteria bacterium]
MESISLKSQPRTIIGARVKALRRDGTVPAVVYGSKRKSTNLSLTATDFEVAYRKAGKSGLIDLSVGEGAPLKVLVHEIQHDPVTGKPLHVDFYEVDMAQKTTADVELHFIGTSKAVKELGGVLMKALTTVTIECLPQHLVQHIDIDISNLNSFDDVIRVSDIPLPTGVTVVGQTDTMVARVQEPRSEEELKALEETPAGVPVTEVEKVGEKEKAEAEAAPEEGAAPAAEKAQDK